MNLLDENTYRWIQTVWGPLLAAAATALVTAIVSGVVAIVATRQEAGRAEKRAQGEAVKRSQREAVVHAYESLMDTLYDAANGLQEVGHNPLVWRRVDAEQLLLGEAEPVAEAYELMNTLGDRPANSGLTMKDLEDLAAVQYAMHQAYRQQLDRIEKGGEPVKFKPDAYTAAREAARGKFKR